MVEAVSVKEKVKELIREGKLIESIKTLRVATGWGLKESKDYCDNLKRELDKDSIPF
ncbi:MAG: hypothetical protein HQK96_06980 [Nitrospirae bacterium]|nr:hypothetical protein [Nitrospirota bacterium]